MKKEHINRIDKTAETSYKIGNAVGLKTSHILKKSTLFIVISITSIIISILFFIWGFLHHKNK
jgi:hypothetical protein